MNGLRHLVCSFLVMTLSAGAWAQEGGAPAPEGRASEGTGYRLFLYKCGTCPGKLPEAPTPGAMKQLTPEKIYETITTGTMKSQAADLTAEQKVAIAEGVSGRKLGMTESGDATKMSNVCSIHPPVRSLSGPAWNGWSPDPLKNTRSQPRRTSVRRLRGSFHPASPMRGGALAAVRLRDGLEQWAQWIEPQQPLQSHRGVSAAVSLIPGAIFVAGLDGSLRAFSTFNGKPLWQYDTTQKIQTVNGIEAAGGSIGSAGPVIVDGMVYVTSGYIGFQGGQPGNLLLAFGPPED